MLLPTSRGKSVCFAQLQSSLNRGTQEIRHQPSLASVGPASTGLAGNENLFYCVPTLHQSLHSALDKDHLIHNYYNPAKQV